MSLYVMRACRAKDGKGQEVEQLLRQGIKDAPGSFLYQSLGNPNDYGVFVEFADEEAAKKFAAANSETDAKLAGLIEGATDITAWKLI